MKIGILVMFAGRRAGGPEIYEVELLRALARIDEENEYHVYCLDRRARARIAVIKENFVFHTLQPSVRPISLLTTLPLRLLGTRNLVLHAPTIPPPLVFQDYMMTLVCSTTFCHPELYPPMIRLRLRMLIHRGIRKAKLILCVSNSVKELCAEAFRVPPERLMTVYLAANSSFRVIPEPERSTLLRERYGIHTPYFLFSGRWERRKNIVRILDAFALFKRRTRSPHKLVLTGGHTWASKEAGRAIARHRLESEIIDVGRSELEALPILYGGADALVFASLWEGFGMPLVEAMACGTPIITSNCSSMPEIAGDAGLLVDPHSVESIADAMTRIAAQKSLRESLGAAGLARSRQFTWDECAQRTLGAYRRFLAVA